MKETVLSMFIAYMFDIYRPRPITVYHKDERRARPNTMQQRMSFRSYGHMYPQNQEEGLTVMDVLFGDPETLLRKSAIRPGKTSERGLAQIP